MKLKLTFKSASKEVIKKVIEVDSDTLTSLLSDKAVVEIAQKIHNNRSELSGFYLCSITDND